MPEYPLLKAREIIKVLEKIGFSIVRSKGSHQQMKKGNLLVTVPVHNRDIPLSILKSIIRQSGLSAEEFIELLK